MPQTKISIKTIPNEHCLKLKKSLPISPELPPAAKPPPQIKNSQNILLPFPPRKSTFKESPPNQHPPKTLSETWGSGSQGRGDPRSGAGKGSGHGQGVTQTLCPIGCPLHPPKPRLWGCSTPHCPSPILGGLCCGWGWGAAFGAFLGADFPPGMEELAVAPCGSSSSSGVNPRNPLGSRRCCGGLRCAPGAARHRDPSGTMPGGVASSVCPLLGRVTRSCVFGGVHAETA